MGANSTLHLNGQILAIKSNNSFTTLEVHQEGDGLLVEFWGNQFGEFKRIGYISSLAIQMHRIIGDKLEFATPPAPPNGAPCFLFVSPDGTLYFSGLDQKSRPVQLGNPTP